MARLSLTDGMFIAKAAATGDVSAKISALGTYVDLSQWAISVEINDESSNIKSRAFGVNRRPRVLPGTLEGSIEFTLQLDPEAGNGPEATFDVIQKAGNGRFNFAYQYRRESLIKNGALVPTASSDNPQFAGSAIIRRIRPFSGTDGSEFSYMTVECDLDHDYDVYRA